MSNPSISKKLEVAANVAILVVCLLLAITLVKRYLLPERARGPARGEEVQPGAKLALAAVDWKASPRSLVMVLSNHCHFCSESGPFYKRLAAQNPKTFRMIAVLPQPVKDGQEFLRSLDISVEEVRQASPASLKVLGTPTLLLVDGQGVVVKVWRGKLSSTGEAEVLTSLASPPAS